MNCDNLKIRMSTTIEIAPHILNLIKEGRKLYHEILEYVNDSMFEYIQERDGDKTRLGVSPEEYREIIEGLEKELRPKKQRLKIIIQNIEEYLLSEDGKRVEATVKLSIEEGIAPVKEFLNNSAKIDS